MQISLKICTFLLLIFLSSKNLRVASQTTELPPPSEDLEEATERSRDSLSSANSSSTDILRNSTVRIVEVNELSDIELPEGYNKEHLPLPHWGENEPLQVLAVVNIRGVNNIDMKTEKLTLDVDMYEFWQDNRLFESHNRSIQDQKSEHHEMSKKTGQTILMTMKKLSSSLSEQVWTPDLYFENCIMVPHNDQTGKPIITFNNVTGFMKYQRMELIVPCYMSFFYYPLDVQTCDISLRSYRYFSHHFRLDWLSRGAALTLKDFSNYDVVMDGTSKGLMPMAKNDFTNLLEKLNLQIIWGEQMTFDVLHMSLSFRNNLSFHLAQTFAPSLFFVTITWLCFLLPASMYASRVGITMTTLLTLNTMFISVRNQAPQVSYVKAIDFWCVACVVFAFAALMNFALMSWLDMVKDREEKRNKEYDEEIKKATENGPTCPLDEKLRASDELSPKSKPHTAINIKRMDPDELQRYLHIRKLVQSYGLHVLAGTFGIFNVIFWGWLCIYSGYFHWYCDPKYNEGQK